MTKPRVRKKPAQTKKPAPDDAPAVYEITEAELRELTCGRWGQADNDGPVLEGLALASADELRVISEYAVTELGQGLDPTSVLETTLLRIADRLETAAMVVRRTRRAGGAS